MSTFRDEPRCLGPLRLRPLLLLCVAGVGLRLALLLSAPDLELQSDEANYVYLSIVWNHFGFYFDQHRYLWPPGYSWFLARCLDLWGYSGIFAAKLVQVLASASVGLTTMLFAARLFGGRAARVAGAVWVVYLPLAAFTHVLWNETLFLALFLPALYQLLRVLQDEARVRVDLRIVLAGLLFAGALYLKEAPLYLAPALAALLVPYAASKLEGARRGVLFLAVIGVCVLPWGLRNQEVYGHFVPLGTSMGENAYNGLNEEYRNFDLIPIDVLREERGLEPLESVWRRWFVHAEHRSGWKRSEPPQFYGTDDGETELFNVVDRSRMNTRLGLQYVREHPGWFVRSRMKKLADFVSPVSFYTRHQALGHYDGTLLGGDLLRRLTSVWAFACPLLVLLAGTAGLVACRRRPAESWLVGVVFAYFLGTSMLVAMSRFRLPLVPLWIVFAAGLAVRGAAPGPRRALAGVACAGLVFLWWVVFPETWLVFREMIWRVA